MRALAIALCALLAACGSLGGKDPVLTATATCRAYAATLNSLAAFRASGDLDDEAADRVNEVRAFMTPLCTGEPPTDQATLTDLENRLYDLLLMEQEARNE